jgi:hypothetical protein
MADFFLVPVMLVGIWCVYAGSFLVYVTCVRREWAWPVSRVGEQSVLDREC